jgi:hypothetical protein
MPAEVAMLADGGAGAGRLDRSGTGAVTGRAYGGRGAGNPGRADPALWAAASAPRDAVTAQQERERRRERIARLRRTWRLHRND